MAKGTRASASDGIPSLADIYRARATLAGKVRRTLLVPSQSLSERAGTAVHLKLEQHQETGSFKLRGATNAIASLSEEERAKGVVGVSTGNHGRGLAYAARRLGVRCVVCMSKLVPANKLEGIKRLGAEVRIVGVSQDEAQVEADRLVAEEGMVMVPPFDDRNVIAGQGTLGLEIIEDLPDLATVIVPLSGGGLISGVALAVKTARPSARVIAVTMARGAAMHDSLAAGKPIQVEERPSLADALGGGIGLDNRYTFQIVKSLVDECLLLSEAEIAEAIRHAYREEKQIVEGSGAVGIGALLADKVDCEGPVVVVVSGCNIDMDLHRRIVNGESVDLDA